MILMRFGNKFAKRKYTDTGKWNSLQGGATRRRGDGEQTRAWLEIRWLHGAFIKVAH